MWLRSAREVGVNRHRGQTGVDFLVGTGVFLLTVGFVIAFAPGMFTPFTDGQATPLVANRIADTVAGDFLAGSQPSVLNETCTLAFFGAASDVGCPFDGSQTTSDEGLPTELGVSSWHRINVTLERNITGGPDREVLCGSSASTPSVHVCASPPADTRLAVGPTPPTTVDSVVTASRVVAVDGVRAVVEVRVW